MSFCCFSLMHLWIFNNVNATNIKSVMIKSHTVYLNIKVEAELLKCA